MNGGGEMGVVGGGRGRVYSVPKRPINGMSKCIHCGS